MAVTGLQINIRLLGMIYSATQSARELTEKRKKKGGKTSGSVVTLLIRGIGQSPVHDKFDKQQAFYFPLYFRLRGVKFVT